ncbi:hypothetical protein TL16_g11741 [Triparma laevis f. inornata]|uniref:Uncharacterized protein n=2 Tax=Triparma laevis TaxID=1534972 RepID=A0A9W7ABE4_9STRA|nr:hypothetical protein TrLO_g9400 [Triparma laevis f. longispina]GMH90349.1 hypothetical protein TL16_g11741 [Triparma laevis f. inornata]
MSDVPSESHLRSLTTLSIRLEAWEKRIITEASNPDAALNWNYHLGQLAATVRNLQEMSTNQYTQQMGSKVMVPRREGEQANDITTFLASVLPPLTAGATLKEGGNEIEDDKNYEGDEDDDKIRCDEERSVSKRGGTWLLVSSIRSVRAAHPSFASAKSKEMLKQITRNSVRSNPARFARAVRDMALVNLCMRDVVKDFQERAEKDV